MVTKVSKPACDKASPPLGSTLRPTTAAYRKRAFEWVYNCTVFDNYYIKQPFMTHACEHAHTHIHTHHTHTNESVDPLRLSLNIAHTMPGSPHPSIHKCLHPHSWFHPAPTRRSTLTQLLPCWRLLYCSKLWTIMNCTKSCLKQAVILLMIFSIH